MKLEDPKAVSNCAMCGRTTLISKLFYGAVCFGCESMITDPNRLNLKTNEKIHNHSNIIKPTSL